MSIRVLIADDEPPLLRMVADLIRAYDGFEVAALAADADEAAERAAETRPDVALLDVRMPGGGVSAARAIRSRSPRTHIVAHSAYHDTTLVLAMLRAGATGYVVKGAPPSELIAALEGAARGTTTLSGEAISGMVAELVRPAPREPAHGRRARPPAPRDPGVIDRSTLTSALQPIFDLERLEPVGYEALARFPNHSTRQVPDWFSDAATVGLRAELELTAVATGMGTLGSLPVRHVPGGERLARAAGRAHPGRDALGGADPPPRARADRARRGGRLRGPRELPAASCARPGAGSPSTTPARATPACATSCACDPTTSSSI